MARGMNWEKAEWARLVIEPARPKRERATGPWTHVKREPVRVYTTAEIADRTRAQRDEDTQRG